MEGQSFDQVADVVPEDYELDFTTEGMPDAQLNGLPAKLSVHRVYPVNALGEHVAKHAVVLIHGRSVPGPVVFDLQFTAPDGGPGGGPGGGDLKLSVQRALAWAGIDTFVPSLLGYGKSTRFSLDDPYNASLRGYPTDDTGAVLPCPYPEGCDSTSNPAIFPLDQQGTMLLNNPLDGKRHKHTRNVRFARTDVWVRDIRQVIDFAIERSERNEVALVGYSLGGQTVGRTLYKMLGDAPPPKVSRVVFLNSLFFAVGPPDEPANITSPTFPLTLNDRLGSDANWQMPNEPLGGCGAATCSGHIIPGIQEQVWCQTLQLDPLGSTWGAARHRPTGLNRSPTFSGYGWNRIVAGQLKTPTLVMQGLEDTALPPGRTPAEISSDIFNSLSMTDKVLVQVQCASHALQWEGCSGPRCTPASGTPYGVKYYPGSTTAAGAWTGPHATLKAALIEWIKDETFNGKPSGSWIVDQSGVARPAS